MFAIICVPCDIRTTSSGCARMIEIVVKGFVATSVGTSVGTSLGASVGISVGESGREHAQVMRA